MNSINISYQDFKEHLLSNPGIKCKSISITDQYLIYGFDGPFTLSCVIDKDQGPDQLDFETNLLPLTSKSPVTEVYTQMEKNDKTLRVVYSISTTNSNGEAESCIPIPSSGRAIAYGDAEFEVRHFGDYIKIIEITDLDRLIAWQIALSQDPGATAPVSDEVVQSIGYPQYPCLDHYDERSLPNPLPPNTKGDVKGGMGMTFQYGSTETQPVGGYGNVPGNFYLRIVCQKAEGHTESGQKCQVSIDWAEYN